MEYLVTNPLNYFFGLLFLSVALLLFTRLKWYWHLPLFAGIGLVFFMLTPMGANFAVALVTSDDVQADCDTSVAVVLLGNLAHTAKHHRDYGAMSQDMLSQAHSAVEWLNENMERNLVVSGAHQDGQNPGSAQLAYNFLLMNGISRQRIIYNPSASSYYEGATSLAKVMENMDVSLIVSDIHFGRARLAFESQGFSVCPLTLSSWRMDGHPILMILPSAESIGTTKVVLWEIIGLVWYWWTDRI
ncbi:MAG: ElyC/SanA/YdcF family protein [Cellvibrionaceae bacterium]